MRYLLLVLLVALAMLTSCRSVKKAGEATALVAGVTAMVAVSPAIPVVDAVRDASGKVSRTLTVFAVYRVEPHVYVIPNVVGWFTDKSEFGKGPGGSKSAWVIDTRTARKDSRGRIVLDWQNLNRWYLRDIDRGLLESIPQWSREQVRSEYFRKEPKGPECELRVEEKTIVLILTQEKEPNQALQTTSVTRSGFGKVPVFDRHRLGV